MLLRGSPGSGKSSCVLNHISKYTNNRVSDVKTVVINVTEITTASNVADRIIEQMSWTAGHTYVPLGAKKLVCILDGIHKVRPSIVSLTWIIHYHSKLHSNKSVLIFKLYTST